MVPATIHNCDLYLEINHKKINLCFSYKSIKQDIHGGELLLYKKCLKFYVSDSCHFFKRRCDTLISSAPSFSSSGERDFNQAWRLALIPVDWQLILIIVGLVVCLILIGIIIILILQCRDRIKQPRPRTAQNQETDMRK